MAKFTQRDQKITIPINIFSIISLDTGIFGWILGIFTVLVGFAPPASYFHFDQSFFNFLVLLPGLSWLIGMITGIMGLIQIKRKRAHTGAGLAKWGLAISGSGIALFYGLLLLGLFGFYMALSSF